MKNIKTLLLAATMLMAYNPLFADDQDNGQIGVDISNDKVDVLKAAVESGKLNPNRMPNGSLISPLGLAIEEGSQKCIDYLMSLPSVNVNATYSVIYLGGDGSKSNHNALFTAVKFGDVETANKLLDRGVEADFFSKEVSLNGAILNYTTTLIEAMYQEKTPATLDLAQRIADKTKQLNRMFTYTATAAEKALMKPNVSLLYRLIGEGIENRSYFNPVLISLIERGAKADVYFTPAAGADDAVKQYLSEANYAIYKASQKYVYMSPLLAAAQSGNDGLMRYMIEKRNVPYARYDDKGALVFASCKTPACLEVMLEQGVDVNTAHPAAGLPVLFMVASAETSDLFECLLKHGADLNVKSNGSTIYDMIKSYPKKRQNKLLAIIDQYK